MKNTGKICVAGLVFDLQQSMPIFDEFVCHSEKKSDGQICYIQKSLLNASARLVAEHNEVNVYVDGDAMWIYALPWCVEAVQVSLSADNSTIAYFIAPSPDETAFYPALRVLMRMAFESVLINSSRLSLHSACVEINGEAVAFTGVSGMGKSTRANAWVEANGAAFISGDRPALEIKREGVTVYGVPWDGKEQIFRSVNRPLKAILEVRRSDTDYIRKLTAEQAQKLLARQVFIPMWDTGTAVTALMSARKLSASLPVYRVFCGPDPADAKEIYRILFNDSDEILEATQDMKIKEGFVLRKVADEYIVMPTGENIVKFDGAVVLNEVSAFIFEKLQNPVSKEDLVIALCNEYEVDSRRASDDIDSLLMKFKEMGITE